MENLIQEIIKFDTIISTIIAIGIILAMCYVLYSRSGSTYSLYHRLWSLLVGEKSFHDVNLENYMQQRKDLDKFNAIFNTEIRTNRDLKRFHGWLIECNVDVKKISEAKGNFDFKNLKMRKPNWTLTFLVFILSIILFLFGLGLGLLGVTDKAVLNFHDDETWILINHEVAKPIFNKYTITKKTCLKENFDIVKIIKITKLHPDTINMICRSFSNEPDKKAIDNYISNQKSVLWIMAIVLFISFKFFIFSVRRLCARDSRKHIMYSIKNKRNAT